MVSPVIFLSALCIAAVAAVPLLEGSLQGDMLNVDWCTPTRYCQDGYHCCTPFKCCPDDWYCYGEYFCYNNSTSLSSDGFAQPPPLAAVNSNAMSIE